MLNALPIRLTLTAGERCLLWAYLTVGFFGAAFGLIVVLRLAPDALFSRSLTIYEYWIVVSGVLGPCLALRISREKFGLPSVRNALAGMGIVTFVGSIIAGTLALPLYGTMFGPFTVLIIFWAAPTTLVLWAISLTGVHFMLRQWQSERESIFGPRPKRRFQMIDDLLRDMRIR